MTELPIIEDHIVCPFQQTETFSFKICFSCSKFEHHIGAKNPAPHCRCQKTKAHKDSFEVAALSHHLGMPFLVVVDGGKEEGK